MTGSHWSQELSSAVLRGEGQRARELTEEALAGGAPPEEVLDRGLIPAMAEAGKRFDEGVFFLPELMFSARAMKEALELIRPLLAERDVPPVGRIVIGTVAGDLHDVGKNIVGAVFSAAGYEVIDLRINVSTERFVSKVQEVKPDFLGLSALLTTTMHKQREVVQALEDAGLRKDVKILIGGAPASESGVKEIKADVYAEDAFSGLRKAEEHKD